ncbi:MAG: hypothetical protein HYZ54_11555 [Ignavibacteriae bacterium]|nr:hypothetical protein [Ignavibacteriota bacterium]
MFKKMFLIGLLFSLTVVLFPTEASSFHRHHRGRAHVIIKARPLPLVGIIIAPSHHRHHPYYHRGHYYHGWYHGYYGRHYPHRRRF